jgi:uncharacterized protein (DUF2062 family)
MRSWIPRRLFEPLLDLLKQGISPGRLALSVAIGIVVGNIPILGLSTILCTIIALTLRLNSLKFRAGRQLTVVARSSEPCGTRRSFDKS